MANWTAALSIVTYISATAFVIMVAGGQTVDQLSQSVASLQTELAKVVAQSERLETQQAQMNAQLDETDDNIALLQETATTPSNATNSKYAYIRLTTV